MRLNKNIHTVSRPYGMYDSEYHASVIYCNNPHIIHKKTDFKANATNIDRNKLPMYKMVATLRYSSNMYCNCATGPISMMVLQIDMRHPNADNTVYFQ